MGMRCDVQGATIKMSGLLAEAVRQAMIHDAYVGGGTVTLTRSDVVRVTRIMRQGLLCGHGRYATWNKSVSGSRCPLANYQDILAFRADVEAFARLADWLHFSDEEELTWS